MLIQAMSILKASVRLKAIQPRSYWLLLKSMPMSIQKRNGLGFVVGQPICLLRRPRAKKEVLDAIVPDRLLWFESDTTHDFWLNSKALEALGVDKNTADPKMGLAMYARDKNGEPSGWVKEGAGVQHFAEHFALEDKAHQKLHRESVKNTLQILSGHGITSVYDAGNKGFGDLVYSYISELEKQGKLPVRYYGTYQIFTPERAKTAISEVKRYRKEYGGELLQFNSVKLFMDGISANQSAAYIEPYVGKTTPGTTMLSVEELRDLTSAALKLDLMVHAIGDLATRTVLDGVEAANHSEGRLLPKSHCGTFGIG